MPLKRTGLLDLVLGLLHAAFLIFVAIDLGYSIGPAEYSLIGLLWRYGGLVLVAAVPVWLAARHRIGLPLIALLLTTGYILGMELTPPGPTFRDVAELERLNEPTGIMVVENGLYIVRYMVNASVWTVGYLFLGTIEYTVRTTRTWLPDPRNEIPWLTSPMPRQRAVLFAAGGGLLHAFVMVWYAFRLGVTITSSLTWVLYAFGAIGMWLLAAVPLYLLGRQQLYLPATLLTGIVFLNVFAAFTTSVEDPHVLYFGAWFVYLGVLLIAAAIEYGGRQLDIGASLRSMR